jgi:translocation and assembly module TamB
MTRRLFKHVLLLTVVMLCLLLAFGYWLTRSDAGRDFVLTQAQQQLPVDSRLNWQSVEGHLIDGLSFKKLRYSDSKQSYSADSLRIRFAIMPLLFRRLNISLLQAEGVRLQLPQDDEPFEFPRWPESLPALNLPIAISIDQFQIGSIAFYDGNQLVYALSRVQGDLALGNGALRIRQIKADSVHGRIELTGYYLPSKSYSTALQGRVHLKTDTETAPPALLFSANGNAKRFVLDVSGALPDPVRLRWQLSTQDALPFWLLSASTERFEPSRLGFADGHAYRAQLAASGNSRRAQIVGEVSRDGKNLIIEPSALALADDRIELEDVRVQFDGAVFTAKGSFARDGELASQGIDVTVSNYQLPLAEKAGRTDVPVKLNGLARWSGRLSQWQLRAAGELQRGKDEARFELSGSGTDQSMRLPMLRVQTKQGGLNGRAEVFWKTKPSFAFTGQLQQFDPSYFFADFPGAINAETQFSVEKPADKDWQGRVQISNLGGNLRGRNLAGKADVRFEGVNLAGSADIRIGSSKLVMEGRDGKVLDVVINADPLQLNDLHPSWQGRIQGRTQWRGTHQNPQLIADLSGSGVKIFDFQIDSFQLQVDTDKAQQSRLTARNLRISDQDIETLDIKIDGHWRNATYQASIRAPSLAADSNGRIQFQTLSVFQITPNALQLDGPEIGQWQLKSPVEVKVSNGGYRFTPFCLITNRHSASLCAVDDGDNMALLGQDFPLAMLEPWLNNAGKEFSYDGSAVMSAKLPKSFDFAGRGFADIRVARMKIGVKPNADNEVARLENVLISAQWLGRQVSGTLAADLPEGGRIDGALSSGFSENAPLLANLKLQVNELSWLELFSLDIAQPNGKITGQVEVSGSRSEPRINGSYRLQDFNVQIPALGLKLTDGQITATSRDNLALLVRGSIKSGEGRMKVVGVWDPVGQLPQPIDLSLTGKGIALADTPDLQLTADTDLLLGYSDGIYRLNGDLDIVRGAVNLETLDSSVSISNDVVVTDPAPEMAHRDLLRLSLKLNVSANDQVKIRGYGLNGTVSGKVAVNSPYDSPTKLTGILNLQGAYVAYGQNLQIKRGKIEYANSLMYEPRLDILTERIIESENMTVGLQITGSAAKPKTRVIASQSMTDSEALSWLLFGQPLVSVSAGQASTLNARSIALNAGGSMLVGTLGRQIGLDQATISGSRALGDSTLTIGKQLSPRFFVSYGVSLLGIGQVITLKYLLKNGLDISIETEQSELREQSSAALNWRK